MEEALANLATAPVINRATLASLAPIPARNPQDTHLTSRLTTPATMQATLALPATFGTTPALMEEALANLAAAPVMNPTLGPIPTMNPPETHLPDRLTAPAAIQATLILPGTFGMTPTPMKEVLASLATAPVMNPVTLASLALFRETLLTNQETDPVRVLPANQVRHPDLLVTNPTVNPSTMEESQSQPIRPIEDLLSKQIPRIGQQRDRPPPLTNRDGLVLVRKSTLLTKLRNEWRYLLDSTQIDNFCFFF
jgi:hypothetical protein